MPFSNLYKLQLRKKSSGQKSFAVLLDPDNLPARDCPEVIRLCNRHHVDYLFVGGSLVTKDEQSALIRQLKQLTDIPVLLFPSSSLHIDAQADGILLLSLISGRNPELLIGQHVLAAPLLQASQLTILPTGYMLVESGRQTTASYMSGTTPLPHDKPAIAASTALAGQMLGLQWIYLDGGSGALNPVSPEMIAAVRKVIAVPLIVGGGINTVEKASAALGAGADVIVVGNHIEQAPAFIGEVADVVRAFNKVVSIT
jgi:phosphoglycerol geranylgeranyltransferase